RERITAAWPRDVRVITRVLRVRPQVAANDAEPNGAEVERQTRRPALGQRPVHRELAEAEIRSVLHEVVVRIEVVVERAVVRRRLLAGRVRTSRSARLPIRGTGRRRLGALVEHLVAQLVE